MGVIMYNDKVYSGGGGDGTSAELLAPTPFIYSDTEEQVGIDENGKPIYQKTFIPTTPFSIQSGSGWYTTGITITNLDRIITTHSLTANNGCMDGWMNYLNYNNSGTIYASHSRSSAVSIAVFTIQYTKTTDTAWRGGFKAYGFSPVIYSDTEREIGVWRDGKPLYQKTFRPTSPTEANTAQVVQDISSLNIDVPVNLFGNISNVPINWTLDSSNGVSCFITSAKTGIAMKVINSLLTNITCNITIKYTKTTDTAGSGKYTTLGTPSVHYSTEEQVIGTWIDGKTLYRRTITDLSIALNGNQWVGYSDINYIDKLVDLHAYSNVNGIFMSNCIAEYYYYPTNHTINLCTVSSTFNRTINVMTIEYTKTS